MSKFYLDAFLLNFVFIMKYDTILLERSDIMPPARVHEAIAKKINKTYNYDEKLLRIGTIVKSEVKPTEWTHIIKSLLVADQDYALIAIRKLSVGSLITVKNVCPSCNKEFMTEIDTDEFEVVPFGGESVLSFELKKGYVDKDGEVHKVGKVRFPNGLDREVLEPVARNNIATANTLLLSRIVTELGSLKSVNDSVVRKLTSGDRQAILKVIEDANFGYKFEADVECPICGHEFEGQLSAVNFL